MSDLAAFRDDAALLRQDERARRDALDAARSFLVQAPAGSGKTELLIQRFLALLGRVDVPERIVALTFTRKAAGEMRERVVAALREAASGAPLAADRPHEHVTRERALAALAQDERCGWSLVDHPARLRILTFDALTTWLVRSAPFSAGLGPAPGYADDARALYAEAAAEAIAEAGADDPHWQRLLVHLHNDADRASELVARLLARRDQLLQVTGVGNGEAVREALHAALEDEARAGLRALQDAFPAGLGPEIARLARFAVRELAGDSAQDELVHALVACAACGDVPACTIECLPLWRALASWLLTKEGAPRSAVDKRIGFPAAGQDPGKAERVEAKQAMVALLARLREVPGLAATLHNVATMPTPDAVRREAWEVVEALLAIVPRAAARLQLTFRRAGEVDFTQASLAALAALGEPEAPSELLERLDYRLGHLLIDEFQDTSATQLEVLRRLTSGWTPGEDGRTIFAVGDPMQSIYRFREAEVRLFVEAQKARAVAGVPVECLTLARNFRSQKAIVDWVNATFPQVLGRVDDPTRGAVAFKEASAARPVLPGPGRTLDLVADARDEALTVVRRVREAQGTGSIAILVRARTHLAAILPALRDARIPFAAVELDRLGQRQAVQDLLALTHALLQPGDRLAWLAILRAPWCGLVFADLLAIAEAAPPPVPIAGVLEDPSVVATLSADGRRRLERVRPILRAALQASHAPNGVAARVRGAWLALGGPACLADPLDVETAERFFEVIAAHEVAGDVPEWHRVVAALDQLYAAPEPTPDAVQVMTMHKAKGLQFDTVVLPGLGARGRGASHELLRWRRRDRGLLIAPSPSPGADRDAVYDYLSRLEDAESSAELGRLLYVACTRAKSRLHLIAAPGIGEDEAGEAEWRVPSTSSLAKLWPVLAAEAPPALPLPVDDVVPPPPPPLVRLPLDFAVPLPEEGLSPRAVPAAAVREDVPFDWAQERARVVGTLAHRLLARLGEDEAARNRDVARWTSRLRAELAGAGFADAELAAASDRVLDAVRNTLADARGRWLFDPSHAEPRSEWGVAGVDRGELVHVVLDRTFVADGERWIVDFKTGTHEGGGVAGFLDREAERYREQLQRYGRLARALDGRPVRLALYYPLVAGGFREIPAEGAPLPRGK